MTRQSWLIERLEKYLFVSWMHDTILALRSAAHCAVLHTRQWGLSVCFWLILLNWFHYSNFLKIKNPPFLTSVLTATQVFIIVHLGLSANKVTHLGRLTTFTCYHKTIKNGPNIKNLVLFRLLCETLRYEIQL